jgi:cobalt-zinc-cadmium efflux system outer membrane protein
VKAISNYIRAAGLLLLLGACATVDPRHDYAQVSGHIRAATAVAETYDPADPDIRARVERHLVGGLTADEAVQVALLNNPNLHAAFMDVGMARAEVVQAGLFSNPFLGLAARFPDGGGLANLGGDIAQNIAELWQIPVRGRVARRELDRTVLRIARDGAELAAQCKAAYYHAVGASQHLAIARENLTIAASLLDMAIARQQAGAATELDVNLSRSLAIDAELAVESARLAASDERRRLATLLGLESDAESFALVDPLPEPPSDTPSGDALVAAARVWRLDVRSGRHAVAAAASRVQEERRRLFPVVEIGIAFEREERRSGADRDILADTARASVAQGGLTAPDIEPRSARRGEKGQDTIIGPSLGVELPLFDQNQARIAKAEYAHRQALSALDALERVVTQEVRGAVDRALTAWRVAGMYRDRSVPLAERNLELSRQAYQAGQTSFLSVLEAQRFFLDSRRGYVEAARAAAVALPELERVIGLPLGRLLEVSEKRAEDAVQEAANGSSP